MRRIPLAFLLLTLLCATVRAEELRYLQYEVNPPHGNAFRVQFSLHEDDIAQQSHMLGTQRERDAYYQQLFSAAVRKETGRGEKEIFYQFRDQMQEIQHRAKEQLPDVVIKLTIEENPSSWRLGYAIPSQRFAPQDHAIAQRHFADLRYTYAEYERQSREYEHRVRSLRRDPVFRARLYNSFDQHFFTRTDLNTNITHIDYGRIAVATAPALAGLAQAIRRFRDPDQRGIISRVLALLQSIDYDTLGSREDSRSFIGGFFPPALMFNQGRGDCDIKTTAMAALLTRLLPGRRMAIVLLPGHALLGVVTAPRAGDEILNYKGKTYVLMEPVGPAFTPIGEVDEESLGHLRSGNIEYVYTF